MAAPSPSARSASNRFWSERVDRGAAHDALALERRRRSPRDPRGARPTRRCTGTSASPWRSRRRPDHAHQPRVERGRVGRRIARGTGQLGVRAPVGQIQLGEPAAQSRVPHDDHPPALAVAAARRKASELERPHQCLLGTGSSVNRRLVGAQRIASCRSMRLGYPYSMRRSTRAGAPAAIESGSMSLVTTLPAPITQRSPMRDAAGHDDVRPQPAVIADAGRPLALESLPGDGCSGSS